MTTPTYKGPGQPAPSNADGFGGWLGGLLGAPSPTYKTPSASAPTPTPVPPVPCKACPSTPKQAPDCPLPSPLPDDGCGPFSEAVIPVGPGPITIIIQPRS